MASSMAGIWEEEAGGKRATLESCLAQSDGCKLERGWDNQAAEAQDNCIRLGSCGLLLLA
jgi:alpha-D-ribose 1-methylphosphonate 5-triphosphate synthase subunit PhnG